MSRLYSRHIPGLAGLPLLALFFVHPYVFAANQDSAGEDRRLYEAVCTQCHALFPIEQTRDGRAGWEDTVHKMAVIGAELTVEEIDVLVDYLVSRFGPSTAEPMVSGVLPPDAALRGGAGVPSSEINLPEGEGKALVQGFCVMCHDLGRIAATPRDANAWRRYVRNMLGQNDMRIDEQDIATMVAYLQRHFGSGGH